MRFPCEENEDRPLFTQKDDETLQRIRIIVEKLPQTGTVAGNKVPFTAMLVTFAIAKALRLNLHVGVDIVHPNNITAWYWLVTDDDAYIDLNPRLIRGTEGIAIIHPKHPFRGFHVYRTYSPITSFNMFFQARGEHGKLEEELVEEIIGHIYRIEGTFPSSVQSDTHGRASEIVAHV